MSNLKKTGLNILMLFFLFGCSTAYKENRKTMDIPSGYKNEISGKDYESKWWESFNSRELNELVERGLKRNNSIKASFYSMKKAEAAAEKAGADLFPALDVTAGSSLSTTHSGGSITEVKSSSLGLAASYEIDLWGRIDSEKDAAILSAKASREDLAAAGITIAAEIVNLWKDIVGYRQKLQLEKKIEEANISQLEILKLRFKNGMANASDVYDQEKTLLSISSEINTIEQNIKITENRLAYYSGGSETVEIKTQTLPEIKDIPDAGVPADLLESRPDVKAAKLRFSASASNLDSAKKELFPKLSLSGSLSIKSDDFSLSFNDWLSSIAANLTAPIFKGGYLKAEVKRSHAEMDEYFYDYASKFYLAINEVQDALAREEHQKKKMGILKKKIEAAEKAFIYSKHEYESGDLSYLSVIERFNTLKTLEASMIDEWKNLIEYRVSLFRAIGNSWTDQYTKSIYKEFKD